MQKYLSDWRVSKGFAGDGVWPLPNVWLGVSVENQHFADERIPLLLQTPAAVRFISAEPLLGPVDLTKIDYHRYLRDSLVKAGVPEGEAFTNFPDRYSNPDDVPRLNVLNGDWFDGWDSGTSGKKLDWVIVGGESGPGARPMHPDWARSLRDRCQAAGVKYFFKQWGEYFPGDTVTTSGLGFRVGKKKAGRILDGLEWNEYPQ